MDVPNPEVGLGALEDHLEIDTSEPGRETRSCDSAKSLERAHDVDMDRCSIMGTTDWNVNRLVWSAAGRGGLDLDDPDSKGKETKGHPLSRRKGLAQEDDGEGSRCENLHLIGDLECSDGEIAYGDELKGVLNDIENGRDREFPRVGGEDLVTNVSYRRG